MRTMIAILFFVLVLTACSSETPADDTDPVAPPPPPPAPEAPGEQMGVCEDPRPEVCTFDYVPVCGQYEKEVPCDEGPCDVIVEWRDYGNACSACSHPEVAAYKNGEC